MRTPDRPLWSTKDLANATGLTQQRIGQLLKEGIIIGYKIGREWAIQREEALRFIEEYTQKEDQEQNDDAC